MKLLIAGSRMFDDFEQMIEDCDSLLFRYSGSDITIISGGQVSYDVTKKPVYKYGADHFAEEYAKFRSFKFHKEPADWNTHGKSAGPIRNKKMAPMCDRAMIYWDGVSKGTKSMINELEALDKPYNVNYNYKRYQP